MQSPMLSSPHCSRFCRHVYNVDAYLPKKVFSMRRCQLPSNSLRTNLREPKIEKTSCGSMPRTPLLAFALHTVPNGFQKHRVPMLCPAIVPDLATPLLLQLIIAGRVDRMGTLRPRLSYATVNMNTSGVMPCQWVTLHNM